MKRTTDLMQAMASGIDQALNRNAAPKQNGFVLLVFPLNGPDGARTNYVSNCNREDIVVALKEIIARFEGQAEVSGTA